MTETNIGIIEKAFLKLQNEISSEIEFFDKNNFISDNWTRNDKNLTGYGISKILTGDVIEKAGVNFSFIKGNSLPKSANEKLASLAGNSFQALGVSVVVHPKNPFIPTSHLNVRFFSSANKWWFGGGYDLTPYYPYSEDCIHWHKTAKNVCDDYDESLYQELKINCDEYFFLPHRNESRGIGGIFFDNLNFNNDWQKSFDFTCQVGKSYINAYTPIISSRKDVSYQQQHRDFQLYRRGRYVEFNLIYDRGTLFGLKSKGRIESIMMSLPPLVKWEYDNKDYYQDTKNLLTYFKVDDWINSQLIV